MKDELFHSPFCMCANTHADSHQLPQSRTHNTYCRLQKAAHCKYFLFLFFFFLYSLTKRKRRNQDKRLFRFQ